MRRELKLHPKPHNFATGGGLVKHSARGWQAWQRLSAEDGHTSPPRPLVEAVDDAEKLRRTEAVLFLSPEGIASRKLAKLAGLADATEARTLIRQLNLDYDRLGRAYRVEEVAGGYAILTRAQFAPWLRRLNHIPGETRLGQSAIETLAIVAYRQPVLRANVEAIRGVGCSEVLKQLMELDLVRISGRSEDLGRPYLYGTTRRFLQMFGLRSADRLPRIDWVNSQELNSQEIGDEHPTPQSSQVLAGTDSETKESTVKMSLSATSLLDEESIVDVEAVRLQSQVTPASAIDDEDDDFIDDDDDLEDDDFDDDDEDWDDDDDEDDVDDVDEDEEDEVDAEEGDDAEESEWEEVDDDDDEDWDDEDEDDDDDDDWDEEDEEDDEEWD